jgi:hypothetical protein
MKSEKVPLVNSVKCSKSIKDGVTQMRKKERNQT